MHEKQDFQRKPDINGDRGRRVEKRGGVTIDRCLFWNKQDLEEDEFLGGIGFWSLPWICVIALRSGDFTACGTLAQM